jgi:ribosome-associated heat shock protein Hsp15
LQQAKCVRIVAAVTGPPVPPALTTSRLDQWLDVACLFKTRSEAQKACKGGKVEVNRQTARAHRMLRPGDEVRITRAAGRRQIVVVLGFAEHHVPKAEARALYEDRTPPPTPEQLETRRLLRALGPRMPAGPVTTRQKRAVRRLKQGG